MADVTLTYNGQNILEMSASGTKTLKAAGKICKTDIEVAYVKSGGGGSGYNILKGISPPSAALGQDGDVYLQYCELPSEYQRIEYLDFVPSIGILVTIPSSDRMLFRARYMSRKNATQESCAFGYRQYSTAGTDFELGSRSATKLLAYVRSNGFGFDDKEAYTLGSVVTSELVLKNPKTTALVGAYGHYSGSTVANMALDGRFYWAQMVDLHDFSTVCWLVPCYRKADNQLGVYDHIAQAFYYETYAQSGTTPSITAGPDVAVANDDIIASFVKVNGAWQALVGSDVNDVVPNNVRG